MLVMIFNPTVHRASMPVLRVCQVKARHVCVAARFTLWHDHARPARSRARVGNSLVTLQISSSSRAGHSRQLTSNRRRRRSTPCQTSLPRSRTHLTAALTWRSSGESHHET